MAKISARRLTCRALSATDFLVAARLSPGKLLVKKLSMTASDTRVRATGQVVGAGHLIAVVKDTGADVPLLRNALGIVLVLARLKGAFLADAPAPPLSRAVREARINGFIAMRCGSIADGVIEVASTDLQAPFRATRAMSPVSCRPARPTERLDPPPRCHAPG